MKKRRFWLRDLAMTLLILSLCFCASVLMQDVFQIPEQVTTTFAFAVFLISLVTEGYGWGLLAAAASVLLVNWAFTFPYFALNFIIPSNFISAVVMAVISVLTSALTTKVKHHEAMKAETERERMRANLLRAVSHDLRTPLTTIYGSTTALLEHGEALTAQQQEKMLRGIQEDAHWLVRMVENLLSVTRIDAGNVHLHMVSTAVDELVDAVIVKFHKHYPGQDIELELPEELVMIQIDPMLIEQVLINLLENAVQHSTGMTRLMLSVTVSGEKATFRIADNGCGIRDDQLPHLFTGGFLPSDRPADNGRSSMGIGLTVCATIIRAHGGNIQVRNLPQGGAEFRFTLNIEETVDDQ